MTLAELEEKYPDFEYFEYYEEWKFGWTFKTDNFKVKFELKNDVEIKELTEDENFIKWLNSQFENALSFQKEALA